MVRPTETLGALGVTHGDVLRLDVVQDSALDFVLRQLYKQAKSRFARSSGNSHAKSSTQSAVSIPPTRTRTASEPSPTRRSGTRARRRHTRPRAAARAPARAPAHAPAHAAACAAARPLVPSPVPGAAKSSGAGGCLKIVLLAVAVVGVVHYWDDIRSWGEGVLQGTHVDGYIRAGSGGRVDVVDHNSALDFAYRLYLNDRLVGQVRNPRGGTSSYDVTFRRGRNVVELRYADDNGAQDTRLQIRINHDQFRKEFYDDGKGERLSFQWVLDGS